MRARLLGWYSQINLRTSYDCYFARGALTQMWSSHFKLPFAHNAPLPWERP